ncbi:MAG: zf-HC2 domain-containing protein [Gemmatimonadetes bacterium]|nr:zf-HC2 domain-containing protein [Gemmatimonadota bacterium]
MKNCSEIRSLCYPYLDGELAADQAELVEVHLAQCVACADRFSDEERFLELVAEAGPETAPAEFRARMEALFGAEEQTVEVHRLRRPVLKRLAAPLAAAAVLLLLVLQPGDQVSPLLAEGFVADHVRHASLWPSINPFPANAEVPRAPAVTHGHVEGLSRCTVDGRAYAHYVYQIDGQTMSAFLPLDASSPPSIGTASIGRVSIVAVDAQSGGPAAVLASGDMSADELTQVWSGI